MARRAVQHLMQREASHGLHTWQGYHHETVRIRELLRQGLVMLVDRELSRALYAWHSSHPVMGMPPAHQLPSFGQGGRQPAMPPPSHVALSQNQPKPGLFAALCRCIKA